ncbi:hypothetical protein OEA41_004413 [Lepraria neglecta]|uniref:BTB domain-containing protein n=1 Tax=Lepraria neglecta TaxID=209136 RepID=A0AAE0DEH8_9LECA|nr:hypothetical protein OEA41_004413 [Lepraria neglecta]
MFARRNHHNDSFSKHRASKSVSTSKTGKRSFRDHAAASKKMEKSFTKKAESPPMGSNMTSPIITLCVGPEQRLFAAHEDILSTSPFFAAICRGQFLESSSKRVSLPEEIPEVFSSVLEYLYKGDYYPRLLHNKRRNTWELEDTDTTNNNTVESTVYHQGFRQTLLKDTLLYCTAERYGLDELKRLALRKQGLQSGIQVTTILASARYAYANTPENDSKLRAHYLALIIRSRNIFKRSGTMQMEMEAGGLLFFDLFVAICNHMDDITSATKSPRTPRTPR